MKSKVIAPSTSVTRYSIGIHTLQRVDSERELGAITESSLSVSKTCQAAKRKAMTMLGLLKRTLGKFDPAILPIIVSCYIHPYLKHSIQAWSPWLIRDQQLPEAAQRWATKMTRALPELDIKPKSGQPKVHFNANTLISGYIALSIKS
ncbi:hypothetical protein P879_10298 [Paragonimus westermani]|uniref:Uncharacterized protein n=1 Tax=Paragonimus westermani TaxID=34504 RepID=A0A8T0D809_9TREM|nr:hypothetical protein P879_10298 [Paragonimus westermani]